MKIKDYPVSTDLNDQDALIIEGSDNSGTKRTSLEAVKNFVNSDIENVEVDNLFKHQTTFRNKNLGTSFTNEQKEAISNGTFDDLYVGDYWVDGTRTWRIMDINYPIYTRENHLVIMPDSGLYNAPMMTTGQINSDGYGYYTSDMRSNGLTSAKSYINNFFGNGYLVKYDSIFTNGRQFVPGAFSPIALSAIKATNCVVELPSVVEVFGRSSYGSGQIDFDMGGILSNDIGHPQFNLCKLVQKFTMSSSSTNEILWLRDFAPSTSSNKQHYYLIYDNSLSNSAYLRKGLGNASNVGVRPFFLLKGTED